MSCFKKLSSGTIKINWNFENGEKINVYCYSNLDEIELFVNGKSYGKKQMERNWYLTWENVVYETGGVTAKGYKDGKEGYRLVKP